MSRILNLDTETPAQPMPFVCSQCGTDFTPTWKWDKAAKGRISDYLSSESSEPSAGSFLLFANIIAVSSDDPQLSN